MTDKVKFEIEATPEVLEELEAIMAIHAKDYRTFYSTPSDQRLNRIADGFRDISSQLMGAGYYGKF